MGDYLMIKKFQVTNFKGFKDTITFDMSNTRDYCFNSNLIKNGLVNKAIIYGKNGSGKSNLGLALYDLTLHLTDKQKYYGYQNNYRNLDNSKSKLAVFIYTFLFEKDEIIYEYGKSNYDDLAYENISINKARYLEFDYRSNSGMVYAEELKNLNIDLPDNKLSIVKYIYRNTPTNEASPITKIVRFAEGMLWFRCLVEGNSYIGFKTGSDDLNDIIIKNNKVKEFEDFLSLNGLHYKLFVKEINGKKNIFVEYNNGFATFNSIISSGTRSLWLYYSWSLYFKSVSFLYLDEFDAYYHFETAELILKLINQDSSFQAVVTSHNTYLMQNALTRPDCCFIIFDNNEVKPLCDCTEKEIREAHNLEKMYRNGAFVD